MISLKMAVLAAALSLPAPWYPPGKNPETQSEYEARLQVLSEAIAEEAREVARSQWGASSLAFATLTTMYRESRFSIAVHSGERLGDGGRAACLGQLHVSGLVPRREWKELTGVDMESTRSCARATMRVLIAQQRRCARGVQAHTVDGMARTFAAYGSGRSCRATEDARSRARLWASLRSEFAVTRKEPDRNDAE